jgi:hypothetical protein
VRFETGVAAGRVNDNPTVRIEGPWDRQAAPAPWPRAWTVAAVDEPAGASGDSGDNAIARLRPVAPRRELDEHGTPPCARQVRLAVKRTG